ncbi:hypothetical protein GQ44DRAFT_732779 [Phaeosphaeriaceae sp. PMI808]|nr:hypothetical protein GQ44DRAFT_732779 [Phaeosphaeriaceae sp. PMI808]
MKLSFLLSYPISLAFILITLGPLSYAAPPLFQEKGSITSRSHDAVSGVGAEHQNMALGHLVRRGCISSKEEEEGIELTYVCDGNLPSADEVIAQMQKPENMGNKVSAFYTLLSGKPAIGSSKLWMNKHPELIPCNPGYVMFDGIVSEAWDDANAKAIMGVSGNLGTVRVRAEHGFLLDAMWILQLSRQIQNTIQTQNPHITDIVRTDPTDPSDPPSLTTIWRQGDPTEVPKELPPLA